MQIEGASRCAIGCSVWAASGRAAAALRDAAIRPALAQKKTIRSVPIGSLKIVDPIWTTAYITRNHAYMVWDTLFALDANNVPQPQMVDSWTVSDDKLTYTFKLRDGPQVARQHARARGRLRRLGQALGRQGRHGPRAAGSSWPRIEAVDDKTFKLVLKQPVGFVLEALGKIDSNVPFMMPERIAKTDPNTQITEVIGSGPFRFVKEEFVPGSKVVYEKFEGYVPRKEPASQAAGGKVVKVDRVESTYLPDAAVATAALAEGELDLLEVAGDRSAGDGGEQSQRRHRAQRPARLSALRGDQSPASAVRQEGGAPGPDVGHQADRLPGRHHQRSQALPGVPGRLRLRRAQRVAVGAEPLLGFDPDKAKAMLRRQATLGAPLIVMDPTDNTMCIRRRSSPRRRCAAWASPSTCRRWTGAR